MTTMQVRVSEPLDITRFAALVNTANRFQSDVSVEKAGKKVNAKSILGVISLGITSGSDITFQADGNDATEAVQTLASIIN